MQRKVKISPYNHIRFIPMNMEMAQQYNTLPFDYTWFSEQIRPWEQRSSFAQPIQKGDKLDIQIWSTQTYTPELKLYDCQGKLLNTSLFQYESYVPIINENGFTFYVHRVKSATYFAALQEDNYTLVITVPFESIIGNGVDSYRNFISEPLSVKAKHPGTLLVETSHSSNKSGIVFKQTRQKFRLRVSAAIIDYEAKVDRTVFVDQGSNSKQTSAVAYRGMKFCAGGDGKPVPDYMIFMLNHAFTCDSIIIDGAAYTTVEGSKFEKDSTDALPLHAATIEIGDKYNKAVFEYAEGGIPIIEEIPPFPFVLNDYGIGYQDNYDYYFGIPSRFADDDQLDAFIVAQNLLLAQSNIDGQLARQGDSVVFNNGAGEYYNYAYSKILVRRLGIKNTTTGVFDIPLALELRGDTSPATWVVSGPTEDVLAWGEAPDQNTFVPNNSFIYSAPGAGIYTFELWHEGTLARLYMFGNSISGIDKYGSELSLPPLANFGINGSTRLTAFNFWGELNSLRPYLVTFRLQNNINLTNVGTFYTPFTFSVPGWEKLHDIILQGNRLNVASVDAWFNSMRSAIIASPNAFYVFGGSVFINGQNPAAGITSASALARASLINNYNWGLTY